MGVGNCSDANSVMPRNESKVPSDYWFQRRLAAYLTTSSTEAKSRILMRCATRLAVSSTGGSSRICTGAVGPARCKSELIGR